MIGRRVATAIALALAASSCGGSTAPEGRVVSLTTTACGHASATSGAGVLIGGGLALVAGHVALGAGSVDVEARGARFEDVSIVGLDAQADLALLAIPESTDVDDVDDVELGDAQAGETVHFAGGGPSAAFDTEILRRVEVRIEEIDSPDRIARLSYEIDHRVVLGDSGAGLFDADGRLVGVVYGRGTIDDTVSFAVRREEIAAFLADVDSGSPTTFTCDPSVHRVVAG